MVMRAVESWGRLSRDPHEWAPLVDRSQVAGELSAAGASRGIAHGSGLSYGDQALNPGGRLWSTRGLDRFIAFDADTGLIECESGVTLDEIIEVALPCGWFLPVTPGTRFVTVGGAIANDVHGKNHHGAGTFGDHVKQLELVRSNGQVLRCGPDDNRAWFDATVGGMGLTAIITRATIQLRSVAGPWIESHSLVFRSVEEFVRQSEESLAQWEYTVAWIDCLATRGDAVRGVLFRGNHAAAQGRYLAKRPLRWPLTPPVSAVNRLTLHAFNALYWQRQKSLAGRPQRVALESFFYPLDALRGWNRMYGPRGFFQYQCVVPPPGQVAGTKAILQAIARSGQGSFLGVLKTFGDRRPRGMLSFPMPGITLALDFPNAGPATARLFEQLDDIVLQHGGRLYAAKDARMSGSTFSRGYPRLPEFLNYVDPGLDSSMARRLIRT